MLDTARQAPMPQSVPNSSLFIKYSVMVDVITCIPYFREQFPQKLIFFEVEIHTVKSRAVDWSTIQF